MSKAVISVIGHDRPGLVSDLTKLVNAAGLNIEDSRMTVLGGEFAVLMALEGTDDALGGFERALSELCQGDDLAHIYRTTQARSLDERTLPYKVTVVALDHPGIVHALAGFFSAREINIRDLNTQTQRAAHTGTPIFNVSMIAEVSEGTRIADLKSAFEQFCADQDLDGELHAER